MKIKLLFIFLFIVYHFCCYSQSNFVRPSISVLELKNNKESSKLIMDEIPIPLQFDQNNLPKRILSSEDVSPLYPPNKSAIISIFKNNNIGSQVISSVLPIRNGIFSNEIVKKRGLYSATDAQINALNSSQNKNFVNISDNFGDIGIQQLDQVYVLFLYVYDYQELSNNKLIKCKGRVTFYLIKSDNGFKAYKTYKSNPERLKTSQWGGKVIYSGDISEDVTAFKTEDQPYSKFILRALRSKFSKNIGERVFLRILRNIKTIQPKSTIIITPDNKISAKIGSKEALKIDNRFYAYEKVLTASKSKDSIAFKKVSLLRVKKVGRNMGVATGKSDPSIFYKIAGRKVSNGMLLVQKEDAGVGLSFGYGTMQWFRFDFRLKNITPGMKFFLALNDPSQYSGRIRLNREILQKKIGYNLERFNLYTKYISTSFEAGLEWSYVLNSRLLLIPFSAFGTSLIFLSNQSFYRDSLYNLTWYNNSFEGYNLRFGARLAINLSGRLSLVGSTGYSMHIFNNYTDFRYSEANGNIKYLLGRKTADNTLDSLIFYDKLLVNNPSEIKGLRWDICLRYEF